MHEDACRLAELVLVLGRHVMTRAVLGAARVDFWMTGQIVFQTFSHILALRNYPYATRSVLQNLVEQQRIVCAAEDYRVNLRVFAHKCVKTFLHEIVGSRRVILVVLYQRHPQRAGYARNADVGIEFLYLKHVALALYRALGGEYANVARLRDVAYTFSRGADYAEHTARRVELRQVVLLYGAQSFCRRGVARQNDEVAAHREQFDNSLARKLIYHIERTRPVRRTGVVAEIKIVVLRKNAAHLVQYCQSSVA